jgi:hypothetical protein
MSSKILCDPYIWENPKILMYTSIFAPNQGACASEVINHIVYTAIVLGVTGFAFGRIYNSAIPLAVALVGFLVLTWPSLRAALRKSRQLEAFRSGGCDSSAPVNPNAPVVISSPAITRVFKKVQPAETVPTARNPFMNVLVDEYKYNPQRPGAASVTDPAVRVTLDDFFRVQWAADPTDVFGRSQSQRQFITMPSTGIPNDVDSLQKWLYMLPGKSCKEGGSNACLPGTDGGSVTWLNQDS